MAVADSTCVMEAFSSRIAEALNPHTSAQKRRPHHELPRALEVDHVAKQRSRHFKPALPLAWLGNGAPCLIFESGPRDLLTGLGARREAKAHLLGQNTLGFPDLAEAL